LAQETENIRDMKARALAIVILFAIFCGGWGCTRLRKIEPSRTSNESLPVATGLDRIAAGEHVGSGERVGLIAHRASVTADGRHAIDVLDEAGYRVVQIFSPEHGLRGEAAAGETVAGGRDPISGIPIVSLYGEQKAPLPKDLEGVDLLVFDLQGAGVRFYTYVTTLILSLDAAAAADLPLLVLDRPNPLGGTTISGPVSAPRDVVAESFVNRAPGPLVHGMTLGEMALLVNGEREEPAEVRVLEMQGWQRDMTWFETGRDWTPPSPNLRTPEAALVYPGIALLEATNVSEGRGTDAPFLHFGAPWLDAFETPEIERGVALSPIEFKPLAGPTARHPKYDGEACRGFRIEVTDSDAIDGYALGIEIVSRLSRHSDFEWRREGQALTWLVGTPKLLEAFERGSSVREIVEGDHGDHRAWRAKRQPFLLY